HYLDADEEVRCIRRARRQLLRPPDQQGLDLRGCLHRDLDQAVDRRDRAFDLSQKRLREAIVDFNSRNMAIPTE
ncbi:MAG: hypothetical protein AAF602_23320, partial [Myxococcota bacterium]